MYFSFLYNYIALIGTLGLLVAGDPPTDEVQFSYKSYPSSLSASIETALASYPELAEVDISFELVKPLKTAVMQAQPKVLSLLFDKKQNRRYRIKISETVNIDGESVPIFDLPEEVLVGWFAHELGHIQDYLHRSKVDMLSFGLRYVISEPFMREAELRADHYAIEHGLYDFISMTKKYILEDAAFSKIYRKKIKDLYPSPKEIKRLESKRIKVAKSQ
ncbi:hypothetical protein [Penaeicola halotolerans]|uniref:hypothetical protein n=1 Tax=Penaeicola halotolerans TaxID=2793196 RepID=UPI001CF816A4|nr:hypothetical protein [Penaeicola halotolerans]